MPEPEPLINRFDAIRVYLDRLQQGATRRSVESDEQLAQQRRKISEARSATQRENAQWRVDNVEPLIQQALDTLGARVVLWERAQRQAQQQRAQHQQPGAAAMAIEALSREEAVGLLERAVDNLRAWWRRKGYWTAIAVAAVERLDTLRRAADLTAGQEADLAIQQAVDDHHGRLMATRQRWRTQTVRPYEALAAATAELDGTDRPAGADWSSWLPPAEPLGAIRIGGHTRRGWDNEQVTVPALFPFPATGNLVVRAARADAEHADTILGLICRMLASVPPGQLRLTVVDPLSLGGSVRSLAGLNSDDVKLMVDPLIEPYDIERSLADLVRRISRINRDLLGPGRLTSLVEYNRAATGRPEAYHAVIVFDYPRGFTTPDSLIKLDQVMSNGPRCGVYTLLVVTADDADHPHHLELTENGQVRPGPAAFTEAEVGEWELELDRPAQGGWEPSVALRTVVEQIADQARDAERIVVSLERMFALTPVGGRPDLGGIPGVVDQVSPLDPSTWWAGEATDGLVVPIGIRGLDDVQALWLGDGTRQHAMIAGTTGSGKSTLLHTLIMSAVTVYSPQELELYLIDLKGGVEFQDYATHRLAHARVVALNSEREFGLETMRDLLGQSRDREALFKSLGVRDLPEYRRSQAAARPGDPLHDAPVLPRVLLVIDEFHVLFDGDDAVSREAANCLSQLVRQGRAFGIHVLMASQTPSSPAHLGSAVLSQIYVRVALRCPENVSRRILAENNTGASRLSLRGEALYNPNCGELGSDSTFQVSFQEIPARTEQLDRLRRRAEADGFRRTPSVYDGHRPGDITAPGVVEALADAQRTTAARGDGRRDTVSVWLGEPMGLAAPVAVEFSPRARRSLLAIGDDEASVGVLTSVAISLAVAGIGRSAATADATTTADAVTVVDLIAGERSRYAGVHPELAVLLPGLRRLGPGAALAHLTELAEEVRRRALDDTYRVDVTTNARFVLLNGLQAVRDLSSSPRGFGAKGLGVPLDALLTEGPAVGVFVIATAEAAALRRIHSDLSNEFGPLLTRWQAHSYDHRVQSLIGRQTGNLRDGQAMLIDDDVEHRLRPYQIPPPGWLTDLARRLPPVAVPSGA